MAKKKQFTKKHLWAATFRSAFTTMRFHFSTGTRASETAVSKAEALAIEVGAEFNQVLKFISIEYRGEVYD